MDQENIVCHVPSLVQIVPPIQFRPAQARQVLLVYATSIIMDPMAYALHARLIQIRRSTALTLPLVSAKVVLLGPAGARVRRVRQENTKMELYRARLVCQEHIVRQVPALV